MRPTLVFLRISAFTLCAAVIVYSLIPQPPEPFSFDGVDKIEHALAYAALSLLFCLSFLPAESRPLLGIRLIVPLCLIGAAIEFIQPSVGRHFDWFDMAANACGVLSGWVAFLIIRKIRLRIAERA
jgi:VanZ family protein